MLCAHAQIIVIPTPELKHHGKEVCAECGAFRRWVPKPETLARHAETGRRLVILRKADRLTLWERQFIASLDASGPKLSPKQQAILDRIWNENT